MTAHTSKHGKTAEPTRLRGTPQLSSTWSPWAGACDLQKQQMLLFQRIMLTEDSPKAPVGGIRLVDVGLCGVSDLQDWHTHEEILKPLESHFLVVAPLHLVGLTLLGQGCCNCRNTRNELSIVDNKTQEDPDVGLRYRSSKSAQRYEDD